MPDQLDSRLQQAFRRTSTAWQPSEVSADDVVAGVRRQRAQRRRRTTTIGCVAVVVLALGAGTYSYASAPHRGSASSSSASSAATVAGPTAPSGAAPDSASTAQQQAVSACPATVKVGSGASRCAGTLSSPPLDHPGFSSADNGTTATGASLPPRVTVTVGQHISVTLAPAPVGLWGAPGTSTLSEADRKALGIGSASPVGTVHVLATAREIGTRPASAVYAALRPGVVVLTAALGGPCAATSGLSTTTDSPTCTGIQTQWTLVLLVVAH